MPEEKQEYKKTGATPQVVEGVGGSVVHRVAEVKCAIVEFTDGFGKRETKLALILGNGEVRFFDDKTLSKPAQKWLSEGIIKKLG